MFKQVIYAFVATLFLLLVVGAFDGLQSDKDKSDSADQVATVDLTREKATVKSVSDGDTLSVVRSNGETEKVRMLLIDTPESVHPTKPVQPFGVEASNFVKNKLKEGKEIEIEIGNPDKDKYGRLLAYVWIDGKNLNQLLIEKGYARVGYVYPPNTKYLEEFQKAEDIARASGIGIWSIEGYVTKNGFDSNAEK